MKSPEIKYDLQIKHGNIYGKEEEKTVIDILRRKAPTSGIECKNFEEEFAEYCGVKYARVVTNGTAALFLSAIGIGIRPGDKVLTTPLTWIATAAAPATLGADVDFVDIDPENYNIDPEKLKEKVTPDTKAVFVVHLYGQTCDMDPILELSEKYGFAVIEDACHAVGADYRGKKAGSIGTTGCFSFHEQKNISTLGEGGMITTNDSDIYERISLYRSHCARVYGKSTKYCSIDETQYPMGKKFWYQNFDDTGYNFRMTDIQAAVGRVQLKKLDLFNLKRIENANYLTERLKEIKGLKLPKVMPWGRHVYHLYPVVIQPEIFGMNKEDFIYTMLHEKGIKMGTHYTPVVPLTWAFKKRGFKDGQFPVAESVVGNLITLPINPGQTKEALDYLIDSIKSL
ncbi:MAG: DegT/DnrJ/EryC1/StrS family aminotransferase [Spirochaetes bacterium]|nr:DegT/DnrJ/EryC1/StrS family aminotransferase [Spirochaetota bacterium]